MEGVNCRCQCQGSDLGNNKAGMAGDEDIEGEDAECHMGQGRVEMKVEKRSLRRNTEREDDK